MVAGIGEQWKIQNIPKWGKRHWKEETGMHHMSIDSIVL